MFTIYARVLRKYAVFSGCADRNEFWLFTLPNLAIVFGFGFVYGIVKVVTHGSAAGGAVGLGLFLYACAIALPSLALTVRRLHDTGLSGWYILLTFVPYVGMFVLWYLCTRPSRLQNARIDDPARSVAAPASSGDGSRQTRLSGTAPEVR